MYRTKLLRRSVLKAKVEGRKTPHRKSYKFNNHSNNTKTWHSKASFWKTRINERRIRSLATIQACSINRCSSQKMSGQIVMTRRRHLIKLLRQMKKKEKEFMKTLTIYQIKAQLAVSKLFVKCTNRVIPGLAPPLPRESICSSLIHRRKPTWLPRLLQL